MTIHKIPMKTKKCGDCGHEKPVSEFYKVKSSPDGYHRYCKDDCKMHRAAERVGKRDKKNGVSYRQFYRASKDEGHEDADSTIKLAKLYRKQKGICALCHEPVAPKEASLDHIKPISKGGRHQHDNVQMTHVLCNKKKGNRT